MKHDKGSDEILIRPVRFILGLAASIAITELFIMVILHYAFGPYKFSDIQESVIDSLLLVILLTPLLYFAIYRPLIRYLEERKVMTDKVAESEIQLNGILDSSLEGFWIIDKNGIVKRVNRTLCKMLDKLEADILGRSICDFVDEQGEKTLQEQLDLRKRGLSTSYEISFRQSKGFDTCCLVNGTPMFGKDGFIGSFAMVTDISVLKKNAVELKRLKDKSEEATALKDKFVSLVAHDLKGPLSNILASIRFLITDKEAAFTQTHKKLLDVTVRSGENMVEIIDELLSISRFRTGKIKVSPEFLDMDKIVTSQISHLQFLASEKGVKLINKVEPNSRLYADYALYSNVIQNLATNGIKFSHAGSEISFYQPVGKPCTLAVADSGVGIAKDKLETLFSYELKTSSRGTGGEVGTGFGLPLCNEMVSALGGRLEIRSLEGQGTTVFIHMAEEQPKVGLVVADKFRRKLFLKMMQSLNIELYPTSSGEELLRLINAGLKLHMIVAEAGIWGSKSLSGLEFFQKIRGLTCDDCLDKYNCDSCKERTPFIFISNFRTDEELQEAMQLKPTDFLAEPFIPEDILPRLRKIVG